MGDILELHILPSAVCSLMRVVSLGRLLKGLRVVGGSKQVHLPEINPTSRKPMHLRRHPPKTEPCMPAETHS